MCEYRFSCDSFLQCVKGVLFFLSPSPFLIFLREFVQWLCEKCKSFDKGAVKVKKTECPSYFRHGFGYWPRVDARDFGRVHSCHPLFKDYPQVMHGGRME